MQMRGREIPVSSHCHLDLCPAVHVQVCGAGLDDLFLNVGLGHLLPRCCLGTRWVSESQGCVSPVQRTPTNEIFRLWALCSPCCLSSQVLWEEHTSLKGSLQLTTFPTCPLMFSCSQAVVRYAHLVAASVPQRLQTFPTTAGLEVPRLLLCPWSQESWQRTPPRAFRGEQRCTREEKESVLLWIFVFDQFNRTQQFLCKSVLDYPFFKS